MKIIVSKSVLEAAVKNLCKVINPKNALPILGDILFDVNEKAKTARLTSSDSEVTLSKEIILNDIDGTNNANARSRFRIRDRKSVYRERDRQQFEEYMGGKV